MEKAGCSPHNTKPCLSFESNMPTLEELYSKASLAESSSSKATMDTPAEPLLTNEVASMIEDGSLFHLFSSMNESVQISVEEGNSGKFCLM